MLLDLLRMEAAVAALAEFHALSSAFEQLGEVLNKWNCLLGICLCCVAESTHCICLI